MPTCTLNQTGKVACQALGLTGEMALSLLSDSFLEKFQWPSVEAAPPWDATVTRRQGKEEASYKGQCHLPTGSSLGEGCADLEVVVCGLGHWTQGPGQCRQELYPRATPSIPTLTSKHDPERVLAHQ